MKNKNNKGTNGKYILMVEILIYTFLPAFLVIIGVIMILGATLEIEEWTYMVDGIATIKEPYSVYLLICMAAAYILPAVLHWVVRPYYRHRKSIAETKTVKTVCDKKYTGYDKNKPYSENKGIKMLKAGAETTEPVRASDKKGFDPAQIGREGCAWLDREDKRNREYLNPLLGIETPETDKSEEE